MIFSRTSQYAIQALYLATQPSGRRVLNREIAQNLGVPLAYLAKILQDLSREKLLHCPADGRRPRRSRVSARAQGLPGRDCLSPASQVETHQEENPRQPWKRNPDPSCAGCSKRPIPVDRSAAGAVAALRGFPLMFFSFARVPFTTAFQAFVAFATSCYRLFYNKKSIKNMALIVFNLVGTVVAQYWACSECFAGCVSE